MLNHIIIMGRLTRDPELRRTGSGKPVASFTLAVDRDFAPQGQEKETDFIDCVAWNATGEFVEKYFTKGSMAVVSGRLQIRGWTDKEGNKRRTAEIVADHVYFGESKKAESDPGYGNYTQHNGYQNQQPQGYGNYPGNNYPPQGFGQPQQGYQQQNFAPIDNDDARLPF